MNDQVRQFMLNKFGADFEKNKQQEYDDQLNSSNLGQLGSNIGDIIAGNKVGSNNKFFENQNAMAKENTIGLVDKAKKDFASDYELDEKMQTGVRNKAQLALDDDLNSAESKIAQSAAVKMGMHPDQAKLLTATKFKSISPTFAKIYEIDQKRLDRQETRADKINTKKVAESAGQTAVDKDYAKDYNDFTGGGETKAVDAIAKLRDYTNQLSKDKGLVQAGGGPFAGSMPDAFRTQASIAQRDNIISTANSALKATFGGQLSDGERKALANEFYNDKLSNEENLKIINRKIIELENGLATQKSKAKFFEINNSSLAGFGSQLKDKSKPAPENNDKQAYEWAIANPNDPRAEKILNKTKGLVTK